MIVLTFLKGMLLAAVIALAIFGFISLLAFVGMTMEKKLVNRGWRSTEAQVVLMMAIVVALISLAGGLLAVLTAPPSSPDPNIATMEFVR